MDPIDPKNHKLPFKFSGERIALVLGGTLIGALAIWFGLKMATPIVKKACQALLESPDKTGRSEKVVSIEAIVVKPGTISRRITTVGKLRANEFVTIKSEIQGRIKEIAFKEGTMVKKGDVLIRFDDEELQAEVVKAEAEIEYRQTRYDRMVALQSKGLTKGPELDQERGMLNIGKAQLDVNKAKLAKAVIYAPFDGKIGLIDVSVGAIIDTQKELVNIVDFDPMKIDFKIAEKFIHDIGVGQTAEVKLDSIPDQIFQATVEAIDSRVDPQTHSIAVRASIPNEDGKLQAGLFGSVGVIVGVKNNALLVPEASLGREGDIEYVWVVINGKTSRKRVLTGTKENGQAEITAGLRPDEIVVTSGQLKLGEGSAVKISNMGGGDVEVTDEEDIIEDKDSSAPPKETAAKEPQVKESSTKEAKANEGTPKESVDNDTAAKEAQAKEAASNDAVAKESTAKETADKDAAAKEAQAKETADKDAAAKEAQAKDAADKDAAAKEAAKKPDEASKKSEKAPDLSSPQPTVVLPPSPLSTTPEAAAKAPATLLASPETTAPQEAKKDDAAKVPDSAQTHSLDKPIENKGTEVPNTSTTSQNEKKVEGRPTSSSVKSFFGKTRDFVVNKFKGS